MSDQTPILVQDIYAPLGSAFTPSMLTARYAPGAGWYGKSIGSRRPLQLDPATVGLHYGQAAFEGLKAYRQPDGGLALFRPLEYAKRLASSCERMAIPPIKPETMVEWWREFCAHEQQHLRPGPDSSVYLRPLIIATDCVLGARPSREYLLLLLAVHATPLADSAKHHLDVLVTTEFVRSSPGGLGSAKTPGNYGAAMRALQAAREAGCDQVLWLDAGRHRWIEELGSMNVAFVIDNTLVTPLANDTILAGVTRDSILALAREHGIGCEERPVALEEVTAAMSWKGLTEAFACSTGAGLTRIGSLLIGTQRLSLPPETPVSDRLRRLLGELAHGRAADPWGWREPV